MNPYEQKAGFLRSLLSLSINLPAEGFGGKDSVKENRQGSVDHPRRAATDTFPRNQMGSGAARYSAHGAANQIWALSGLRRVGPGPAGGGAKPAARLALGPAHGAGAGHWRAAEGWAPPGHRFH